MGHGSTYRILLRKAGRDRIAIMLDSPWHAYDQTKFTISEKGVQDIEEEARASGADCLVRQARPGVGGYPWDHRQTAACGG